MRSRTQGSALCGCGGQWSFIAAKWLIEGEARLVTLTGLGGFGKTRLALEFAHRVAARNAYALQVLALCAPESDLYAWALYHAFHAAIVLSNQEFIHQWGAMARACTFDANDPALQRRIAEGDPFRLHFARTHRAHASGLLGDPDAIDELQACLSYWREQNNSPWMATTYLYLAEIELARGNLVAARGALAESLQRNRALGRRLSEALCLELLARLKVAEGDEATAQKVLAEANALRTSFVRPDLAHADKQS